MPISSAHLTILTATYNRAHLLSRLYDSICRETGEGVQIDWLIIDDGSVDETESVVEGYVRSSCLPITYVKVPHGGKHRALNEGFKRAQGDWVFILDSDDCFQSGGVKCVLSAIHHAKELGATIIQLPLIVPKAKRQYFFIRPNRVLTMGQRFVEEPNFDASLVLSKDLMPYRFPVFEGEFFLAESALIFQMFNETVFISNSVAVLAEYQSDGLSANMRRNRIESSIGSVYVYQQQLTSRLSLNNHLRSLANFGRFWWHSIFRGKRPSYPKGLQQWLVLPISLPFTLLDIFAERKQRQKVIARRA
jgi:hypothetical protein